MDLIGYTQLQGDLYTTLLGLGVTSPVGWLGAWGHPFFFGSTRLGKPHSTTGKD